MSGRGGIIDVFSPVHDEPYRIEFLGDEVESLRFFDPETQLSTTPLQHALITTTAAGGPSACILDYVRPEAVVVLENPEGLRLRSLRLHAELAEYSATDERSSEERTPSPGEFLEWSVVEDKLRANRLLNILPWSSLADEGSRLPFAPAPSYAQRLPELIGSIPDALAHGDRIVLASLQAQRLQELLEEGDYTFPVRNPSTSCLQPARSFSLRAPSTGAGCCRTG